MTERLARTAKPLIALASLVLSLTASLCVGSYGFISPPEVFEVLVGREGSTLYPIILHRLVRSVASIVAGTVLAISGATLQYVLRNPLADPYILGIAGGAGLAVVAGLYAGLSKPLELYLLAALGGLVVLLLVLVVSTLASGSIFSLVISGVAFGYITWAISTILLLRLGSSIRGGLLWLFGTVAFTSPRELLLTALLSLAAVALLAILSPSLSKLALGDEVASSMGVNVGRLRALSIALAATAASFVVALAGPVGFVGLVAPWIARILGGTIYTVLLPLSAMTGSTLLLVSDVIARIVLRPLEVPLTAVTALIGVPVLVYILLRVRAG